ncbi:MAG TPA: hypothetical protein VNL16_05935 [Chloroflexota bacterium]|nr:hypothetical protein [Chloroflexota bacterium]
MWRRVGGVFALGLIGLLAIVVLSSVFLALGTVLAHVFAVSVFEASVIVLVVAAAVIWVLSISPSSAEPVEGEEPEGDTIVFSSIPPFPSVRGGKKRRR